jgi:hypothetical protein
MQVPFGPYAPDRGVVTPGILVTANNVLPIPDGYGPAPTMVLPGTGDALPSAPRGMVTAVKRDGTSQIFAFTATAFYSLAADYTFVEIDNGYSCTPGDDWSAIQFGDFLLYTNTTDGMWAYNIELGGSPAYIADAGDPRQIFPNANMVFALDCKDNSGNRDNRRIRNSDFNDHTNWKTRAADQQPLESGAELIAGVRLKNGAAIVFQRESMRLIQFGAAGGGALYSLQEIAEGRGSVGSKSVIGFDGTVYWLSTNGFWQFSTGGLVPIGDGFVDKYFLNLVPTLELKDIQATIDPFRKIVLWLYPAGDLVLGYNWAPSVTNRWFTWTSTATYLTRLATSGYTWDAAGAIWATWDDMPEIVFDDRFWQGGQQFLAALDTDYMLNTYAGPNAASTLRTSLQPSPVSGMITWANSIDDCATSTLTLGVSDSLSDAITQKPAAGKTSSGRTPLRGRGKNIDFTRNTPAGDTWSYAFGVDNIVAPTGGPR